MAYDFECKHLTKRFDNGDIATLALDDVNLHFSHGDFISIIGPSGSGKSTLLSLIGTLDRPTDGTLLFNGEPITTLSAKQLAVLKALGWQNTSIRRLVLTEGALTGFFAGLLGVTVTIIIVTIMYQQFPTSELPFLFATILIPVVTGVLGAILPAERAVCITPAEAIGGHVVNQKKVEKRFRLVLGTTATALVVGIISLFVFTSPEVKPVTEEAKTTPAPTAQTTGAKQADLKADKPKEAKATTPKEDDLQRIMDLGTFQTFIGDLRMKKREFQVGQPVFASPDGTEPEDGKRFVSLPISLFNGDDEYGGTMDYRPNGFRMYTPDGTEYSPVDMVNHNKKAFRGGFIYTPGEKSEIDLVFLVPEKEKTLVLYASSGAMPKVYTVKIEVP